MPEYGTPGFNEIWIQKGYLAAMNSSPTHGQATAAMMIEGTQSLARRKASEMRREAQRVAGLADRLDHQMMQLSDPGRVDHLRLQRDIVELAGWIASLLESYQVYEHLLTEPQFRKARGMIDWQLANRLHPARYAYLPQNAKP